MRQASFKFNRHALYGRSGLIIVRGHCIYTKEFELMSRSPTWEILGSEFIGPTVPWE